jgi:coenzyme F420-reducing hydrogenase gamma subunit/NAD(P)H-flavin reductase
MVPVPYRVARRRRELADTFTLGIEPVAEALPEPRPGQFHMLWAFGVGEVPISVSRLAAAGQDHTIRAVGATTAALCSLAEGDALGVRGPFGHGWRLDEATGGDVVVVAGGIGLAPLRPLIEQVIARRPTFRRATVLVGARSPDELLFADDVSKWRQGGLVVEVTVDHARDAWLGHVGVVTSLIPRISVDPEAAAAFVCGPEIMMRFAAVRLPRGARLLARFRRPAPRREVAVSERTRPRPRLAVWKFASCDGCQLTLLDCEDELLDVAGEVEIAHFLEASRATVEGPYDLSLVEGSVTTPTDLERIRHVRAVSKRLVTIGACATSGGIQALRNFGDVREYASIVYARPDYISTLDESTPIAAHVPVDFELQGCPIDKSQLLEVISAFLAGRRPAVPAHSVCVECKLRGNICVMVAHGTPCLGPITHAGCGALCPSYDRGCYGCFGPMETPDAASLMRRFRVMGVTGDDIVRVLRTFNAWRGPFREESARHPTSVPVSIGRSEGS